jgi:predicted Zn-dependent protease/Flp pilus assembly protein TadD
MIAWRFRCWGGLQFLLGAVLVLLLLGASANDAAFQQGVNAYQAQDYATAARWFEQAVNQSPADLRCRYFWADSLVRAGQPNAAKAQYRFIVQRSPRQTPERTMAEQALKKLNAPARLAGQQPLNAGSGAQTAANDYYDRVAEGGVYARWDLNKMPLKVYIAPPPAGLRHFQPGFVAQVQKALGVWMALVPPMRAVWVSVPDGADIRVTWVNQLNNQGVNTETGTLYNSGVTLPTIAGGKLQHMEVRLATLSLNGQPFTADMLYATALHEMGHALGLRGHSDQPEDVMYSQNSQPKSLSRRDVNTLKRLYATAADVTNAQPGKTVDTPVLASRLNREISQLLAEIEVTPTALNWHRLGNLYFQAARQLNEPTYFDRALQAMSRAIQLEPGDGTVFFNRALVALTLERWQPALDDLVQAQRLLPKDADVYLQKAWVLAQLQRPGEAEAALRDFKRLRPTGSADEERIRRLLMKSPDPQTKISSP